MKTHISIALISVASQLGCMSQTNPPPPKPVEIVIDGVAGFQDTPMQPGGKWHVHDPARPQPPVVSVGGFSQNATPPGDAVVLFDGKDLSQWRDRKTGGPAQWIVENGTMIAAKGDIETTRNFGDVQIHLEFLQPAPAKGSGQGRGNSGVFFMGGRYEVQLLDNYENKTYADGTIGAIYGQQPPLVNAARAPGEWQTYDILFTAPRFSADGKLVSPAHVTAILNGVVVQNHQAYRGSTDWRKSAKYSPHEPELPIGLQYHNNTILFRNIWVRPIPQAEEP
ncbi:MAG TPA: DUF1080 domain-containing protein [Verrucomicrobiota bacterium]|nr:DUF1080 domain-containing protein [Verrucomicrobiota bacterium]